VRRQGVAARQVEVQRHLAEVQFADHHRRLGRERPAADAAAIVTNGCARMKASSDLAVLDVERLGRMHQPPPAAGPTSRARVSPSATPSKRVCSQWRWKAATTVVVHSSYLPDGAQL
jgi:hypothetical protein